MRTSILVSLAILAGLLAPSASSSGPFGRSYELGKGSGFEEGCFDPCMCPIFFTEDLKGTFRLVASGVSEGYLVFDVREVSLHVSGGLSRDAKGSGTYRVQPVKGGLHRMELDLVVGDQAVDRYDSGWVPAGASLPRIQVTVARNGFYCYDTAFTIDAWAAGGGRPRDRNPRLQDDPEASVTRPITWGRLKALYEKN